MRLLLATLISCVTATQVLAAAPPCQTIRIVAPYTAGGITDIMIRMFMDRLATALNRTIVIENRTGGGSNIGSAFVAKSKPDGCTLLANGTMLATFPFTYSNLSYDPLKDLVPIGGIGATPSVIVSGVELPAKTLPELVKLSKDKPAGLTFAIGGLGLLQHLAVEVIGQQTGANFVKVVYPGSPNAVSDMLTGRVDFGSFTFGAMSAMVQSGQLRALAVLQEARTPLAPEIPTMVEQGLAPSDTRVQFMLFAPAGTPNDVVSTISTELHKIIADPALRPNFYKALIEPTPATPEEGAALMKKTAEYWGPVIKSLKIETR